ncbi:MAG: restriction endonuclease subunit S [Veillonella sp.]|uniref:restriction endonuclease subunit S n=1 Tax=Veillonella sp. TaxID=1926307 RepID=UPI00290FE7A7|nr:restriction endonuclease subunit S [Veillonella sp.]MDU3822736.1 restriction endonuclease subunit S [Veillonella sp.]
MANKPRIRFRGFTEDWEQRKLGDIATFSKGNGYSKSDLSASGNPIILYGRLYTNYETTIRNVDTFVELKDKSVISQGGEVIVPASGETAEDISRASVVKNQGVIIGGDLNVIKVNSLLDPTFLALTISNGEQQKELSKRAQGKSVVHLHNSDLQEVNLIFPLLNEQKEISTIFEKMDNIITLHQCKLKKLNLAKKSLLQKLFPRNGSQIPGVRFKGFTDAWEQRKLIYIFNDFIVPMRDKPKVFSGTTPWTRIEDIEGRYINTSLSGQFVSDETIKSMNLKVIPKGSLIVSASATFGVVAIVNNDLITNQTFIGLVPNKDFDIDFLYSLFEAPTTKGKLLKLSAGSTIFYIARESFENLVLSVPSKEEQIKISKVFKSIDDSITLHQRKLERLQEVKKGLLQKMFV